ncbi:hypothetical protein OIV83_006112 [Microbotryomycetes sp. JL201]|nr:hypothetical protein OIV83_006112 [Microbotryomycetes sp. JL201]
MPPVSSFLQRIKTGGPGRGGPASQIADPNSPPSTENVQPSDHELRLHHRATTSLQPGQPAHPGIDRLTHARILPTHSPPQPSPCPLTNKHSLEDTDSRRSPFRLRSPLRHRSRSPGKVSVADPAVSDDSGELEYVDTYGPGIVWKDAPNPFKTSNKINAQLTHPSSPPPLPTAAESTHNGHREVRKSSSDGDSSLVVLEDKAADWLASPVWSNALAPSHSHIDKTLLAMFLQSTQAIKANTANAEARTKDALPNVAMSESKAETETVDARGPDELIPESPGDEADVEDAERVSRDRRSSRTTNPRHTPHRDPTCAKDPEEKDGRGREEQLMSTDTLLKLLPGHKTSKVGIRERADRRRRFVPSNQSSEDKSDAPTRKGKIDRRMRKPRAIQVEPVAAKRVDEASEHGEDDRAKSKRLISIQEIDDYELDVEHVL